MKTFKLREFTDFLRRVLALNLSEAVWIEAELGQVNTSRGHVYLSLIEKSADATEPLLAQVEAVLWASKLSELSRKHGLGIQQVFQEGMAVRLRVTADFHDRYGFKLLVQDADPQHTLGQLAAQRQLALRQLQQEGLLGLNQQRSLAVVPQRLAVVSSETAAGYADFCQQLAANPFAYDFQHRLFPSAMQGPLAPTEIAQALRRIGREVEDFDAVCIIRGGGSKMDLLAFDDVPLCRAVAAFPLPVLVGVGHETDDVLLDAVAWKALKTPTAVAAFLLDRLAAFEGYMLSVGQQIAQTGQRQLASERQQLALGQRQLRLAASGLLQANKRSLAQCETQLPRAARRCLQQAEQRLMQQSTLLAALRPETTLARGFALLSQSGKLIQHTQQLKLGEPLTIRLQDGTVELNPNKKK